MLGDVKTDILFFFSDPQTDRFVDNDCEDVGDNKRVDDRRECTRRVGNELVYGPLKQTRGPVDCCATAKIPVASAPRGHLSHGLPMHQGSHRDLS